MKKIVLYAMAIMFVLSLGTAYAEAGRDNSATNVNTNFDIGPVTYPASHMTSDNNASDFTSNYDIGPVGVPAKSVEGSHAGGLRDDGPFPILSNGVTDYSGNTYDTL